MVRPSGQHADEIKRLMDMGAEALMVPMIQSAGEAEAMVAAALYPPAGVRGYAAPGVRASGYGMVADYAARANDELFFVAQIETRQAIDNVAAIAGVAGVDMLFLGVGDLSATSGFWTPWTRPKSCRKFAVSRRRRPPPGADRDHLPAGPGRRRSAQRRLQADRRDDRRDLVPRRRAGRCGAIRGGKKRAAKRPSARREQRRQQRPNQRVDQPTQGQAKAGEQRVEDQHQAVFMPGRGQQRAVVAARHDPGFQPRRGGGQGAGVVGQKARALLMGGDGVGADGDARSF